MAKALHQMKASSISRVGLRGAPPKRKSRGLAMETPEVREEKTTSEGQSPPVPIHAAAGGPRKLTVQAFVRIRTYRMY